MVDERRKDAAEIMGRIVRMETQIGRFISDAESEKDTRRRVNESILSKFEKTEERLRKLERTIWMATGAVGLFVFFINFMIRHL